MDDILPGYTVARISFLYSRPEELRELKSKAKC